MVMKNPRKSPNPPSLSWSTQKASGIIQFESRGLRIREEGTVSSPA